VALIAKRDHATFVLCMWALISGGEASGPLEILRMVLMFGGGHMPLFAGFALISDLLILLGHLLVTFFCDRHAESTSSIAFSSHMKLWQPCILVLASFSGT
jgi:hypothetical protein